MNRSRRAKRILVALSLLLTAVLSGVAADAVTDPARWERLICGPVDPVHGHRHICYDTPHGIPWVCGSQMEPVICYDCPGDD